MTELQEAVQRVRKRIWYYEEGLRIKAFMPSDYPISDDHAVDLRIILAALEESAASVGRSGNRQDRETGLGPKDEHAVAATSGETPNTSHTGGSHG